MADKATVEKLAQAALDLRKNVLKLGHRTRIHFGGDYSAADFMTVLWLHAIQYDVDNPKWEGRDRFVLSKGHGAAVTSLSQAARGFYKTEEIFEEYATDYGRFGMHSCNLINPYVDVSTGSLGHGLPVAMGMAQGLRLKNNTNSRVYTVVGDGECDEGSIWEAAMYAPCRELGNLIAFIDRNKLQLDGPTEGTVNLEPFADKWRAFGWNVIEIDGHDIAEIVDIIDNLPPVESKIPTAVICNTVKGKGVSFMENQPQWHYGQVGDEDYNNAMAELDAKYGRGE